MFKCDSNINRPDCLAASHYLIAVAARSYDSSGLLKDLRPVSSLSNQTPSFLIGYYYETPILRILG